ncbi:MAG: DUF2141 domain-containing protein [Novosphingobium sp.]
MASALWAAYAPNALAQGNETPPIGCAGTPTATWLSLSAEGLRNGNGYLVMTVYVDDSHRFLVKHGSIEVGRIKAEAGTTHGCVFLPGPGVYAIALYHDENANGNFDRSGLGLPKEGWGFTNNPHTFFGLPSFSAVRLSVNKTGLATEIRMKYP